MNNEGIYISGQGKLEADQIAVGRKSQAIKVVYGATSDLQASGKAQVAQAIEDLLKGLEAQSGKVPDEQEVIEAIQQIAEEAKKEKPSKLTLKGLLNGIKDVVDPIAELLPKVVALRTAIAAMLGLPAL